jgi:light-independent protochlorophyllide reductase subunit B
MQLTIWTYEGPPHIGAMRIATSLTDVHYVLHAPQGDTYADLLFTMIERREGNARPSATRPSKREISAVTPRPRGPSAVHEAYDRFKPPPRCWSVASCTAELIQDQAGGLARESACRSRSCRSNCRPTPRRRTGERRKRCTICTRTPHWPTARRRPAPSREGRRPRCEPARAQRTRIPLPRRRPRSHGAPCLCLGVDVHVVAPLGASAGIARDADDADFNVVLYPEIAQTTGSWLQRVHGMPFVEDGTHRPPRAPATSCARWVSRPASMCSRGGERLESHAAVVLALGGLDVSHGQAGVHLR